MINVIAARLNGYLWQISKKGKGEFNSLKIIFRQRLQSVLIGKLFFLNT